MRRKWADACYETSRIGEFIELGVRHALSGVPGPAFLEIPMDVLHAPLDVDATWGQMMRPQAMLARVGGDVTTQSSLGAFDGSELQNCQFKKSVVAPRPW